MATRTIIFGFIRVNTMVNLCKGTWKLTENIKLVGGGEISDIKTRQQPKKVSLLLLFSFFLGARLHMSFHRHSCQSIMIICI